MTDLNDDINYVDLNGEICYKILVDGEEVPCEDYIVSISSSTEFCKIATLEIAFENIISDEDKSYVSDLDMYSIGAEIELVLGYDQADVSVFKGIIRKKSVSKSCSILTLVAKHEAERMTFEKKCRIFEQQTIGDTIEAICGEYGISVKVEKPGNESEKRVQSNCSDWDFINIIAETGGMEVLTTPEGIVVKSVVEEDLTDQDQVLDVVRGYNLNDIQVEVDGRHSHKTYKCKSFDYTSQEMVESTSSNSNVSQSVENVDDGEEQCSVLMGVSGGEQELDVMQNMLSVRNDLAFLTGEVNVVGYAPLSPGDVVCLHGVGKGFSGKVLVSSVLHNIGPKGWQTHLRVGLDDTFYVTRFNDIVPKPSMGMLPTVNGLLLAKVEALEGDPLEENRICVRLINSDDMKLWCRIATLDAGNERGSFFLPELEDEVVVGFVDGDPSNAIVLGMLHSSQAPVPMDITNDNHVKGFFSREKIQLLFDDEKKALSIETPGGNKLLISDDEKGLSLEDQNGNTIVMNDQGITIESKKALTLKAAQDVSIEGNNVNIKANAQLVAQGSASAEFSASGNTVIKGGLVQIN